LSLSKQLLTLKEKFVENPFPAPGTTYRLHIIGGVLKKNYTVDKDGI
jgi:hypothetical protein